MFENVVSLGRFESGEKYDNQELVDRLVEATIQDWLVTARGCHSLGEIIRPNSKIVVKPNFVAENNMLIKADTKDIKSLNECFVTNKAVLKGLFRMFRDIEGLQINIIEAPIQFCVIDKIVTPEFLQELKEICPLATISFVDLRRTIYYKTEHEPIVKTDLRDKSLYVDVDIADKSEHELSGRSIDKLRVTDYPPETMKEFHFGGHHIYRIAKEILEADYVFSVPKLKTHIKAGMTGAVKNFIGIIGNKECLPHHAKGSALSGGDCYGDYSFLKRWAENILDDANGYIVSDKKRYWKKRRFSRILLELNWLFGGDIDIGGSWYGNDTIWRTMIDINKIVYYGTIDGKIMPAKQREVFTLIDAVVAGQNDGPMSPQPYYTGSIIFSDSTASADMAAATIMGFDYKKIKYLDHGVLKRNYPLIEDGDIAFVCNGQRMDINILQRSINKAAIPGERWIGHIERDDLIDEKLTYSYNKKSEKQRTKFFQRINIEVNRLKRKQSK